MIKIIPQTTLSADGFRRTFALIINGRPIKVFDSMPELNNYLKKRWKQLN